MPINSSPRGFYRNARPLLVLGLTIFVLFALKKEMHYQHFLDGRHDVYETFDPTSALSRVMSGVVGTSNQQRPNDTSVDLPLGQRACDSFPNMDGISFVMKTGASEAYKKLPTQLSTYMRCIPDTLIFSDKEDQIGGYRILDALSRVSEKIRKEAPVFQLYYDQLACPLSQDGCNDGLHNVGKGKSAWNLDKYKFIHMLVQTWELRPNQEWYVFAEADTYLFWSNIVMWIRNYGSHEETPYVGSVASISGYPFAHGGSGYIVSGKMLKVLVEGDPELENKADQWANEVCCGDFLVAKAFGEIGVKVKSMGSMMNGDTVTDVPYGPGHFCEPVLSFHHVPPEQVNQLWQFEQSREKTRILTFKEVYEQFVSPYLRNHRVDWDNHSEDVCYITPDEVLRRGAPQGAIEHEKKLELQTWVEKHAYRSPYHCSKVCEYEGYGDQLLEPVQRMNGVEGDKGEEGRPEGPPTTEDEKEEMDTIGEPDESDLNGQEWENSDNAKVLPPKNIGKDRKCFQWRYHEGVCCTSKHFSLGRPQRVKPGLQKWHSGWYIQGIQEWIKEAGECKEVLWAKAE